MARATRDRTEDVAPPPEPYLHHGSLNVTAHEHFTAPLTDTRFYAVSHPTPAAAPATPATAAPAHP